MSRLKAVLTSKSDIKIIYDLSIVYIFVFSKWCSTFTLWYVLSQGLLVVRHEYTTGKGLQAMILSKTILNSSRLVTYKLNYTEMNKTQLPFLMDVRD